LGVRVLGEVAVARVIDRPVQGIDVDGNAGWRGEPGAYGRTTIAGIATFAGAGDVGDDTAGGHSRDAIAIADEHISSIVEGGGSTA